MEVTQQKIRARLRRNSAEIKYDMLRRGIDYSELLKRPGAQETIIDYLYYRTVDELGCTMAELASAVSAGAMEGA